MLTNISCSSDKNIDPILITINNSVWTTDKTVGQDYFQEIKDGKREGLYILFLNGQIDLKYYLNGSASYKNVTGLYEYESALVRIETCDFIFHNSKIKILNIFFVPESGDAV